MACVGLSCTLVNGTGIDECTTDLQCNQTGNQSLPGIVIDIIGYTDPDQGEIQFNAITEGLVDYVEFQINFNLSQWTTIGTDYNLPYNVIWSDISPKENVRIQARPYYNNVSGTGRAEGPFQYLGYGNQTQNGVCSDTDGGINYYVRGHLIGWMEQPNNSTYYLDSWDVCTDPTRLSEYSCYDQGENQYGTWETYNCANENKICEDGACIQTQNQTQVGILSFITGYTNYNRGIITFTAGSLESTDNIDRVTFQISYNDGISVVQNINDRNWMNIGQDSSEPFRATWWDRFSRRDVMVRAIPYNDNIIGNPIYTDMFQYSGTKNIITRFVAELRSIWRP